MDFSGLDLSGVDFSGCDLGGVNFSNVDLTKVNLTRTKLTFANFSGAILGEKDFSGYDLLYTNFSNVDLTKVNLTGAKLVDVVNFSGATLGEKDFGGYILASTNFSNVDLTKVNLTGAKLVDVVNFSGAILGEKDFSGYDLSHFDFNNTDLTRVKMTGAKITFAKFSGATLGEKDFSGYDISYSNFSNTDLTKVRMTGAKFNNRTNFARANLGEKDFSGCDLSGVNFDSAELTKVKFTGAKFDRTKFSGANLSGPHFSRYNLTGDHSADGKFSDTMTPNGCNFLGVDVSDDIVSFTDILQAKLAQAIHTSNFSYENMAENAALASTLRIKTQQILYQGLTIKERMLVDKNWHNKVHSSEPFKKFFLDNATNAAWEPLFIGGELTQPFKDKNGQTVPYQLVALTNKEQLIEEGKQQHHCVGTGGNYIRLCERGTTHIVSLRDAHNAIISTMEVEISTNEVGKVDEASSLSIQQNKGYDNYDYQQMPDAHPAKEAAQWIASPEAKKFLNIKGINKVIDATANISSFPRFVELELGFNALDEAKRQEHASVMAPLAHVSVQDAKKLEAAEWGNKITLTQEERTVFNEKMSRNFSSLIALEISIDKKGQLTFKEKELSRVKCTLQESVDILFGDRVSCVKTKKGKKGEDVYLTPAQENVHTVREELKNMLSSGNEKSKANVLIEGGVLHITGMNAETVRRILEKKVTGKQAYAMTPPAAQGFAAQMDIDNNNNDPIHRGM